MYHTGYSGSMFGKFTGNWYVVNSATGADVESWPNESAAQRAAGILNEQERKHERTEVYIVQQKPSGVPGGGTPTTPCRHKT